MTCTPNTTVNLSRCSCLMSRQSPPNHLYAVLTCAASEHAWYFWISPRLLGETEDSKFNT
ncbi:hypothetical protein L210DRAFT_2141780 [Boletus edulis BED1]|uniref:DNA mitochondrial polymerase exonuclease domain-containing protein n=1 Tax=Boletus edulis BED1 TaxID=1328754 RepID=A0AAD4BEG2_BOLED|nr:hypothetical protein L210DRAFT_2141780 [Boletus edulis BED1]